MFGLGTIINTAFVVFGGLIGLLFKKGIKERYEKTLMAACGVSTIFQVLILLLFRYISAEYLYSSNIQQTLFSILL